MCACVCVCVCDSVCACVCWRRVLGLRGYLATLAPLATCGSAVVEGRSLPLCCCAHCSDLLQSTVVYFLKLHRAQFVSLCGFTCLIDFLFLGP